MRSGEEVVKMMEKVFKAEFGPPARRCFLVEAINYAMSEAYREGQQMELFKKKKEEEKT